MLPFTILVTLGKLLNLALVSLSANEGSDRIFLIGLLQGLNILTCPMASG